MASSPKNLRTAARSGTLDATDRALIVALQKNARISNKALAEAVGIGQSTCLERLRRLRERGIVRGYHADVDPALLGRPIQAMIAVRLRLHSHAPIDAFYHHILDLPESLAVYHVGGADDYLVHVAVADTDHLRDLVLEGFTNRPEVERVETRLIFEHRRKAAIQPFVD
jgi:DNA-binding Lrp family transcriptional regulator